MAVTNQTRREAALAAQLRIDGRTVTHTAADGTATDTKACLAEIDPQVLAVMSGGQDTDRTLDAMFDASGLPAGSPVEYETMTVDGEVYAIARPGKLSGTYWTARLMHRDTRHRAGPRVMR